MTSTLTTGLEVSLIICVAVTLLCPLFYWVLTAARPDSVPPSTLT